MGIIITFNTDDLSETDVAVLGAMARSLADPDWVESADRPKRTGGRPKMTEAEKAEAAEKRAAEKRAAEKAARDEAERVATEKVSTVVEDEPEVPEEKPAKPAPAAPKASPKAKPAEPAPEPEEAEEEPASEDSGDSEDTKAEAVRLATALVHDGRGADVRNALKEVGAKKVSDLDGKSLDGFLAIARGL